MNPIRTGLVVLTMMSMVATDLQAQSRAELLAESTVSSQDAISAGEEAKVIRLLETNLRSLSDRARHHRRIGGYVLLGLGVGTGIGGVATLAFGGGGDARVVGLSLLGGAALFSGLSLLPFKIPAEVERIYQEFGEMSENTADQVRRKFYYGDRRFEELAEKRRIGRLIGGSVSILVGLANLAWFDPSEEAPRIVVVTGPVIGGVTTLLVKSDEERQYESYRRAKEDLMVHADDSGVHYGLALLPTGGVLGAVQVRF